MGPGSRGKGREVEEWEITEERAEELGKCLSNHIYFVNHYCKIYDSIAQDWIPFGLWPSQITLLQQIHAEQLTIALKARQLGITWLCLAYALWKMIYDPISVVSLFSRREEEAIYLLSDDRLRGMFKALPLWMRLGHHALIDRGREWQMANNSVARAFPTSAGDGYVATYALVDEADLAPDLNKLMGAVKPTIDMGGKLVLISRANKSEPGSEFKNIYLAAKKKENGWFSFFLPWYAHPNRNQEWYERQKKDVLSRTGAVDDLWEQYPATDSEALAAKTLDKRIPPMWIEVCYKEMKPLRVRNAPPLHNLDIFIAPVPGGRYVIGADPAEGNPTSDDSSMHVVDVHTGEECAVFSGKCEPAVFGSYIAMVSDFYNAAPAMVERNNHGHAVIQWLEEHARRTRMLEGHDALEKKPKKREPGQKRRKKKYGWLNSKLGKSIMYTICAEHFRVKANFDDPEAGSTIVLHDETTLHQLQSIEGATLSAPEGFMDDRATSYALAQCGRRYISRSGQAGLLETAATKGWGF